MDNKNTIAGPTAKRKLKAIDEALVFREPFVIPLKKKVNGMI